MKSSNDAGGGSRDLAENPGTLAQAFGSTRQRHTDHPIAPVTANCLLRTDPDSVSITDPKWCMLFGHYHGLALLAPFLPY